MDLIWGKTGTAMAVPTTVSAGPTNGNECIVHIRVLLFQEPMDTLKFLFMQAAVDDFYPVYVARRIVSRADGSDFATMGEKVRSMRLVLSCTEARGCMEEWRTNA